MHFEGAPELSPELQVTTIFFPKKNSNWQDGKLHKEECKQEFSKRTNLNAYYPQPRQSYCSIDEHAFENIGCLVLSELSYFLRFEIICTSTWKKHIIRFKREHPSVKYLNISYEQKLKYLNHVYMFINRNTFQHDFLVTK